MSAWMYEDINAQHEDQARAERQEYLDARDEYDPRDEAGYPDQADLAREDAELARERRAR